MMCVPPDEILRKSFQCAPEMLHCWEEDSRAQLFRWSNSVRTEVSFAVCAPCTLSLISSMCGCDGFRLCSSYFMGRIPSSRETNAFGVQLGTCIVVVMMIVTDGGGCDDDSGK